jgi:DAK2 domain fusion protein YloV
VLLDAAAVRRWVAACVRSLDEHREAIDGINVFPVADRDTGTNLLRTMRSAEDELSRVAATEPAEAWQAVAGGALAGARGNSGVILSQVLRGFAEVLGADGDPVRALRRADELAAKAVSDPAPGTMLSVLHAAAQSAAAAAGTPAEVTATAAAVAATELANTRRQLEALARAGVVDAGAQGLSIVLAELATEVTGERRPSSADPMLVGRTPREPDALRTAREAGSAEYAYEVMYTLAEVPEDTADALRESLRRVGDCVSVVGDGAGRWTVHVHCNDIGAAIEHGVDAGRPRRIAVVRFDDQVAEPASRFARPRAVVALTRGDGVTELFRGEGAAVLPLADGAAPDVAELVAVLAGTQAEQVAVLPNESGLLPLLEQAVAEANRAGQDVLVVPTGSPVQGLAALAVHQPGRRQVDDVVAMAEAAAATRCGELVRAAEEGITWVGRCQPDDVLGLLDGEIVLIEPGPATAEAVLAGGLRLVDRMLAGGGELVTALPGRDAPEGLVAALAEHVRAEHREVELTDYPGGQTGAILLLGVE